MNAARNYAIAPPAVRRRQLARGCDFALTGGVMTLVVWAPLARGAEGPAAVAMMEQLIFALLIIWTLKSVLLSPPIAARPAGLTAMAAPLAALVLYLGLQLLALSPAAMKIVSSSTHALYAQTAGSGARPAQVPPAELLHAPRETVSIAPALTRAALLKLLAYCAVLLIVAGYPLEPAADGRQERSFAGALTLAILLSALLAGLAGALSLFATHRVGAANLALATARAQGTFHNPDHFADYLMLTIPLGVAAVLSPESFVPRKWREPFTVFAALAAVVALVGLLTSLSRGAWLAGLAGLAAMVLAVSRRDGADRPAADVRQRVMMRRAAAAGCLLLLLALMVWGAPATERIGARLHETANHDESIAERFAVWRDSLAVVRDFPLLGVGLGCWPEIFSRYNRAPWDPDYFWRETHNDYLQLLEETGAIGFLLAWWILTSQARALARARRCVSGRRLVLVAAAIAAAVGFAVHELFDFNFQVPANALLLMVIVGLAQRQAAASGVQWWQPPRVGARRLWGAAAGAGAAVIALLLIVYAARHDRLSYPYNLDAKMDAAQALDAPAAAARIATLIHGYPAHASLHLELAQYLLEQNKTAAARGELETAVWLEPANPQAHDSLAQVLFEHGDRAGSRREITLSVRYSPRPSTHEYLDPAAIPALSAAELKAIEDGYHQALWNPDAVYGLGYFYNRLARFRQRAALYASAAPLEADLATRFDYWLKAGESYTLAGDTADAGAALRRAAALDPASARPYRVLAALYARHHDLARARAAISAGIAAGADPVALNLALAQAAARAGDQAQTRQALDQAMELGPVGFDDNLQIGVMYLDCAEFERAIRPLKAAAAADPGSADGYYYLALAEQNSYNFAAAASAFGSALERAPQRADIRSALAALQREIDNNGSATQRYNSALRRDPKTMMAAQSALKP